MNYYNYWSKCKELIESGNIAQAQEYVMDTAIALKLDNTLIDKILSVPLKKYQHTLEHYIPICIERAQAEQAKAICLFYDVDNGWDSTFYFCQEYHPVNHDWIAMSRSWINIGRARGLNGFYRKQAESAFFCDEISTAVCLLVMFKTTITFWHAIEKYLDQCQNKDIKLCITCSDDDSVRLI
ncbi:hypothetical protein [Thorsellia anophelis]|uniref:Uncharacterized protein n=1 Tax=Thorsellia anophelis DSM 18579 TaxID=1123402 RepID=A0A1H9ZFC3_9GAMM|nr:hypothetical protein [Thorsellia anophelis]SES79535.1 hypothetical protein SAMN02583745_00535 [Thorsellia anophelis DSM 18579]